MVVKSAFYTTIGKDSPQAALDREPSRRALFPQPKRRIPKIPHLAVLARGAAPPRSLGGDAMSTVDPLESINRQLSEALIKALDAPMRAFVTRNQEALQRSLAAPLAELARLQDQTGRTLAPPIARLIEQSQPMIQSAIRGPLLAIAEASEEAIQTALEVPLRQLERHQEAIGAALAGPFVAIARNQELMRVVMEAAASAADSQRESHASDLTEAEQIAWLEEWKTAIAGWTPTWEQVEVFLTALALLLAMVVYAAGQADIEVAQALLEPAGILCAAGALLINRVRHYRRA
jgi:hypothetical protein